MARSKSPAGKTRLPTKPQIIKMPPKGSEAFFRAESDVHTLQQAAAIKSDPKRVRMAKAVAAEQVKNLKKI